MTWADAILTVLKESGNELHYEEITKRILEKGLKPNGNTIDKLAQTVKGTLWNDMNRKSNMPKFIEIKKDYYYLNIYNYKSKKTDNKNFEHKSSKVHTAFGILWDREKINWKSPHLLGCKNEESDELSFDNYIGVYLLYDISGNVI